MNATPKGPGAHGQPNSGSRWRSCVSMLSVLLAAGCTLAEVKLDAKECPCVRGWVCDPFTDVCAREAPGARAPMLDAGEPDALVDATAPSRADADFDQLPDAGDECPLDAAKIRAGVCGCGKPDTDRDADGLPDCLTDAGGADAGGADDPAQESTIFFESFEKPDVESQTNTTPDGWVFMGHPSYISLVDEAGGAFVTPHGQQAVTFHTAPPPVVPSSLTTAPTRLNAVFEAGTIYTLTFHVARSSGSAPTGYVVELLAIDDLTSIETVLDAASGSGVTTSDMSQSDRIVFTTGQSHSDLGRRIAIRLKKELSEMSNPLFDNVRLSMRRDRQ